MIDLVYLSAVQLITEACMQAENCSKRPGSSSETSYIVRTFSGYTITGHYCSQYLNVWVFSRH